MNGGQSIKAAWLQINFVGVNVNALRIAFILALVVSEPDFAVGQVDLDSVYDIEELTRLYTDTEPFDPVRLMEKPVKDLDADQSEEFQRLTEQLQQTHLQYHAWGLTRTIKRYGTVLDREGEGLVTSNDWSGRIPVRTRKEVFLRNEQFFRSECLLPKTERKVFSYDGFIGRIRDKQHVANGPITYQFSSFEEEFAPELPHTQIAGPTFAPNINWFYGIRGRAPMSDRVSVLGRVRVEEIQLRGHPCWHLAWHVTRDDEGGMVTSCSIYLAKDRDLLPIRQVFQTPPSLNDTDLRQVELDSFQKDPDSGLWFPKQATLSIRANRSIRVSKSVFEFNREFHDQTVYSKSDAIAKKHATPPVVKVPVEAAVLLSQPAKSVANFSSQTRPWRKRLAFAICLAVGGITGVLVIALAQTRLGELLRRFARQRRVVLATIGIVMTVGIGYLCTYPPGWQLYGLATMIAGIFGLMWIGLTILLIGDKTLSIKIALFAAASIALCLAGYTTGIKRMKARARMIAEVRQLGGQVGMGRWRLDEDGLFLPYSAQEFLGEAWTGRANRVAIEKDAFTAKNTSRWCLDEVRWLGIACQDEQPFDIDCEALEQIAATKSLWALNLEGGSLDQRAFRHLAKFPALVDLHFNCRGRPLPSKIKQLPQLERIWLTRPLVDDQFFQTIRGIEHLDYITLIDPDVRSVGTVTTPPKLKTIEIQHSTLTQKTLASLGNVPCQLFIRNSNFKLPTASQVALSTTRSLKIQQSDLSDKAFQSFAVSPKLQSVRLLGTGVSVQGVELFSKARPDVSVLIE